MAAAISQRACVLMCVSACARVWGGSGALLLLFLYPPLSHRGCHYHPCQLPSPRPQPPEKQVKRIFVFSGSLGRCANTGSSLSQSRALLSVIHRDDLLGTKSGFYK